MLIPYLIIIFVGLINDNFIDNFQPMDEEPIDMGQMNLINNHIMDNIFEINNYSTTLTNGTYIFATFNNSNGISM